MLKAERYYQPSVPLIDPDSGQKIKLRLRKMNFEKELVNLPSDMLKLHEILIDWRKNRNLGIYDAVSAWSKLRKHERFWKTFGFQTESAYLTYYGLPEGETLARWTVLVKLFDKATFVLLGEITLYFMLKAVELYQENPVLQRKDYQEIFDRYCSSYDSFNKSAFCDGVTRYVEETYRSKFDKKKLEIEYQNGLEARKSKHRVTSSASDKRTTDPFLVSGFTQQTEKCQQCVEKIQLLKDFQIYVQQLERIIKEKIGPEHLPKRPSHLNIF